MRIILLAILLFKIFISNGQLYKGNLEIRDEYSNEFILGAKVLITEDGKFLPASNGKISFESSRRFLHLHIQAEYYEMRELDLDLSLDTVLVIFLHPTSLEMRETLIEHALISNSERSSSVSIALIKRDEMLQSNPSSFAETLESVPGVSSNNVGVGIARPVIRGLAGTRIYVADMGLRQEGQQWGNDHGLEIDQFGVERVELIRGPGAIVFGPDAMAGVVHILSDIWPTENKITGDILAGFKSNNENFYQSIGVKGLKKNFYFNTRISLKSYNDMRVPTDSFTYLTFQLPIYDRRLKNTAGQENNASLTLGYKTEKSKFWIRTSYYDLKQGLFSGAIGVPNAYGLGHQNDNRNIELPSQSVGHLKIDAHHITRLKRDFIWSTDVGFQRNNRVERSIPHLHGISTTSSDTAHHFVLQTIQFRNTINKTISAKSKINFGISGLYQENQHSGFEFLLPNYNSLELGVYAVLERNFNEKFTMNLGLRSDFSAVQTQRKTQYQLQNGVNSLVELSPEIKRQYQNWAAQLGLNYAITHHHIIKLNLARSYRFPKASELAMNGVHHGTFRHEMGNPNLTTEIAYQLDFLYEYHTDKRLLSFSPFINYYNNFIYLRPSGQFSTLPDAGQLFKYAQHDALLTGGEILMQQAFNKSLVFTAKVQYVHAYNLSLGRYLPFIPPLEISFEPEYKSNKILGFHKLLIKPGIQYVFAQNLVDLNEKTTPSVFLLNLDFGFYAFKNLHVRKLRFAQGVQFNFGLRNILNTPYLKHLSRYRMLEIPEPGFNFVFTVRLPFSS